MSSKKQSISKKLTHFKSDLLKVKGSYYIDNGLVFRENLIPYDILANERQVVKIADDSESELISLMVLEIPSRLNEFHYIGYVIEDGKRSSLKKGNIVGFKQEHIYRFSDIYMDYTKEISMTYLMFIMSTRK